MATRDGGAPPSNASEYERKKWDFLKSAPFRDAKTDEIRLRSAHLWCALVGHPRREYAFAVMALAMAKDCISYVLDTDRVGREQIDGFTDPQGPADAPFVRGLDDCDGKSRFFVAMCLASNIRAEMVPRWELETGRLAHVYARAYVSMPGLTKFPIWLSAETILKRARLGDVAEDVPKEPETGKWSQ